MYTFITSAQQRRRNISFYHSFAGKMPQGELDQALPLWVSLPASKPGFRVIQECYPKSRRTKDHSLAVARARYVWLAYEGMSGCTAPIWSRLPQAGLRDHILQRRRILIAPSLARRNGNVSRHQPLSCLRGTPTLTRREWIWHPISTLIPALGLLHPRLTHLR